MIDESTTILKIQIFGLNGTKTSWFLHQTSCNNSLEIILSEIFSGKSPCVSKAKIAELSNWSWCRIQQQCQYMYIGHRFRADERIKDWVQSVNLLLFYLYFTQCFAHYLRINLADKMSKHWSTLSKQLNVQKTPDMINKKDMTQIFAFLYFIFVYNNTML